MYEDIGYHLLLTIGEALRESDAPTAFWNNFDTCVKSHDCLRGRDQQWKRDFMHHHSFRIVMNKGFTIHLVFSLINNKIVVSLEGAEAYKYEVYKTTIQSAVDEFLRNSKT